MMRALLIGYAALVLVMAGCQRHLIYYPSTGSKDRLLAIADEVGMKPWYGEDGTIIGWTSAVPEDGDPEASVVVFHGNAGMAVSRTYFRDGIERATDRRWEVRVLEYPGYGAREGRPGERHFTAAAREALESLFKATDRPVYLAGESLGAGVACRMAAAFPDRIAGLMLITPFSSLPDVGAHHYPFLPVRFLMRDRYDNVTALKQYRGPVAILLAEQDTVVPPEFGRKLYESYQGVKRLSVQPGSDHNTLDLSAYNPWWHEAVAFLRGAPEE